jgi:hypothetical protein
MLITGVHIRDSLRGFSVVIVHAEVHAKNGGLGPKKLTEAFAI